jgi:hypothetical protein
MVFNLSTLYGGPRMEEPNIRFFDYPTTIIQYQKAFMDDIIKIRCERIMNDLYLVQKDYDDNYTYKTICLNVSINKSGELLLLKLFDFRHFNSDIEYLVDQIKINMALSNYYDQSNEFNKFGNIKTIFNFDSNGLLINTIVFDNNKNEIIENYHYSYDSSKRLMNIIVKQKDNIIIQRKLFFYDGILRNIPRPYFHDLNTPNTDEILIFDDFSIRYHLKIMNGSKGNERPPDTLEGKEQKWYYMLFEYNQNGDEIRQKEYYNNGTEVGYVAHYTEYDNANNWLRRIYTDDENTDEIWGEITREIEYKKQ